MLIKVETEVAGRLCGWYLLWDDGLEFYKKAGRVSCRDHTSSVPSMVVRQLPPPGSCPA